MEWRFWRKRTVTETPEPVESASSLPALPAARGEWKRLSPLPTTVAVLPPVLAPLLRAPDVAGTRTLHRPLPELRHPEPVVPAGTVTGLARPRPPAAAAPLPVEPAPVPVAAAEPVEVPARQLPVQAVEPAPVLTRAEDDYVGEPQVPEIPHHSTADIDRMFATADQEAETESGLASLMALAGLETAGNGFSSAVDSPWADEEPGEPAQVVAPPAPASRQRRTLAASRKLGLRGQAGFAEAPADPAAPEDSGDSDEGSFLSAGPVEPVEPAAAAADVAGVPEAPAAVDVPQAAIDPAPTREVGPARPATALVPEPEPQPEALPQPSAPVRPPRLGLGPPITSDQPVPVAPVVPVVPVVQPLMPPQPLVVPEVVQPAEPRAEAAVPEAVDEGSDLPDLRHPAPAPAARGAASQGPDEPDLVQDADFTDDSGPEEPFTQDSVQPTAVPVFVEPLSASPAVHVPEALLHPELTEPPAAPVSPLTMVHPPSAPVYRAALDGLPPRVERPQRAERNAGLLVTTEAVPAEVSGFFQTQYGVDVSGVEVRRGPAVAQRAAELGARAFTQGGAVYLPDEVGPVVETEGRALLAHELVHATQQRVLGDTLPDAESADGEHLESAALATESWFRGTRGEPPALIHRALPASVTTSDEVRAYADEMRRELTWSSNVSDRVQRASTDTTASELDVATLVERAIAARDSAGDQQTTDLPNWPDLSPSMTGLVIDRDLDEAAELLGLREEPAPHFAPQADYAEITRRMAERLDGLTAQVDDMAGKVDDSFIGGHPRATDVFVDAVYDRVRNRLRGELMVDRERSGRLSDFG